MGKRNGKAKGGGAAVLERDEDDDLPEGNEDPTEIDDGIQAELTPDKPIDGPILEPGEVAQYEHDHYEEICTKTASVRNLQNDMEAAKRASKLAKDEYDDAAADLLNLISSGPSIPGRKFARRVRLLREVDLDTELGNFITGEKGEEFDVISIDAEENSVAVLVQGTVNHLEHGCYAVAEWGDTEPRHAGAAASSDAWRDTPLDQVLNVGDARRCLKPLADNGVTTLGGYLSWSQQGNEIRNLKGIGPEVEAAAGDCFADWWKRNPSAAEAANKE